MPPGKSQTIKSKVVGVTFCNADGTDRQAVIRQFCRSGVRLIAHLERNNPHSPDGKAVGVGINGHQIGYIRGELVADAGIARHMDVGGLIDVVILNTTGGTAGDSHGVNIKITLLPPRTAGVQTVAPPPLLAPPFELGWSWVDVPSLCYRALIDTYHKLPEWAQPILWGLAVSLTVLLVVIVYVR